MSDIQNPQPSDAHADWLSVLEKLDAHSDTTDLVKLREDFTTIFQVWLTTDEQTILLKRLGLPREQPAQKQGEMYHRLWTDGGRFHNLDEWRAVQHYKLKTDLIRIGFWCMCAACLLIIGLIYLQAFGLIKGDTPFAKGLNHFFEIMRTAVGG